MTRITHKEADKFIRKYNKHFAIKNYSKMKLDAKIQAIDTHTQRVGGHPKQAWEMKKNDHKKTMNKRNERSAKKFSAENLVALAGRKR
jgi:hypothetical protein